MNIILKYSLILLITILIGTNSNIILAQESKRILQRDSLDYTAHSFNPNSNNNEFNPILYKGGLLFVSNKKNASNLMGSNKVYWVPSSQIYSNKYDSSFKNIKFNDDFTAPTSNDNDILTQYSKKKYRNNLNPIERIFSDFNPDGNFSINESTNEIIYTQLSARKIKGAYRWELWQAYLKDGRIYHPKKLFIEKDTANYLYPHLTDNGNKLLFSSNKKGGKGGYDIYAIEKKNNTWDTNLIALGEINTSFNEIAPSTINNSITEFFYTSNKTGGMGGYDAYKYNRVTNTNLNLGFPLNTINDEIDLISSKNIYFKTTVLAGKPEIKIFEYNPININVNGSLTFAYDSSIVANQKLYIVDKDDFKLIDSITTDDKSNFSFQGKPNRNYLINTINKDGFIENFEIITGATKSQNFSMNLALLGRSEKQIMDSIQLLNVMAELKKNDSLQRIMTNNKYVVYFNFDKYSLQSKEKRVLDTMLIDLKNNPSIYAIVGAFTDCIGSYDYNYNLSVKRGKAVVDYLIKHGLNKNRIISNGYSKKYAVTACLTGNIKGKRLLQQNNRRAEVVFSDTKSENWAKLEVSRGAEYYTVRNLQNIDKLGSIFVSNKDIKVTIRKDTLVELIKPVAKNDTVDKLIKAVVKKDTVVKLIKPVAKKDTVVKLIKPVAKKDTAVKLIKSVAKKDTVVKLFKPFTKKDTIFRRTKLSSINDSSITASVNTNIKKRKDTVTSKFPSYIIAKPSVMESDDELSKEEIINALDSLATLKKEQERIVDYLTKRINKKPIDIFVSSDSVTIEIYDNAIHDKDSVSIIYNNRIVVDKQELKVNKPIKFKLKVDKNKKYNELIMVAENLGSEPPNTAVMFVSEKNGKKQQIMLSTDILHNEVIYFIRIGKE
jgi:outer membrane protein OmpA-like peptidoglycan-associated protein